MQTIHTIGTAGHIDHGKTTLVKALTGIDTDRLVEEKKRGISIVLGFAHFETPGGRQVGIVDVPGHERFIRNMVAGAWGIRGYMLVIAADEGVKPQTREHRDILELLGVTRGIVVLTKADLVDADRLETVREQVSAWMAGSPFEGAPILPCSSGDAASVARIGQAVDEMLAGLPEPDTAGLFRLPVDRVFTLKGHGTVVTGTVASGTLKAGSAVEVLPDGKRSRVRSIQAFDRPVEEVLAGQRAALNLADLSPDEVHRGDLCAAPGAYRTSHLVDGRLRLLRGLPKSASPLATGTRIRLYLGTREVLGRVHLLEGKQLEEGASALVQLRLDSAVAAMRGDRYLLRLHSPVITIGGGEVLDPAAAKHRKATSAAERLSRLEGGTSAELVLAAFEGGGKRPFLTLAELASELSIPESEAASCVREARERGVQPVGDHFFLRERLEVDAAKLLGALESHHQKEPMSPGLDRATLARSKFPYYTSEHFDLLLGMLSARGDVQVSHNLVRRAGHLPRPPQNLEPGVRRIEEKLREAPELFLGLRHLEEDESMMRHEFQKVIKFLVDSGAAMRIGEDLLIAREHHDGLRDRAVEVMRKRGRASTPELKEALGLSRKYLIPFLEHLDGSGVTVRSGNERVLRKGR